MENLIFGALVYIAIMLTHIFTRVSRLADTNVATEPAKHEN